MTDENDNFDLIDWINSGTVGKREVVIYNDPEIAVEFDRLDSARAKALNGAQDNPDDDALGAESPLAVIDAQIEALYERWEASKATWTVRALTDAEVREIHEAHPLPEAPAEPREPKNSPKGSAAWGEFRKAQAEYKKATETYLTEAVAIQDVRNLHTIAAAVLSVTTMAGGVEGITYEQAAALRAAPYGKVRTERLLGAISELSTSEVAIPAPKSQTPSRSTQG